MLLISTIKTNNFVKSVGWLLTGAARVNISDNNLNFYRTE